MEAESIVYGCIKDSIYNDDAQDRTSINRSAVSTLPSSELWPLLSRDMFSTTDPAMVLDEPHTEVFHFGAAYQGVEHEWQLWMEKFETLLSQMFWVSAIVHLETESSGLHSFQWECNSDFHRPGSGDIQVRCEWSRESWL